MRNVSLSHHTSHHASYHHFQPDNLGKFLRSLYVPTSVLLRQVSGKRAVNLRPARASIYEGFEIQVRRFGTFGWKGWNYESSNLFRFVKNSCIVGETKFLFFDDQNCAEKEAEINMMFLQRLLLMHGIDIFNDWLEIRYSKIIISFYGGRGRLLSFL